jgi:hypothetical protein
MEVDAKPFNEEIIVSEYVERAEVIEGGIKEETKEHAHDEGYNLIVGDHT